MVVFHAQLVEYNDIIGVTAKTHGRVFAGSSSLEIKALSSFMGILMSIYTNALTPRPPLPAL